MFKAAPVRHPQLLTHELHCLHCGVILVVEIPKGERSYLCVCGTPLELRLAQAA